MKIQFYFIFGLLFVPKTRGQKSILNIIEKCIPNVKNVEINFVFENVNSDETFHLLFTTFHGNQEIYFSNKW